MTEYYDFTKEEVTDYKKQASQIRRNLIDDKYDESLDYETVLKFIKKFKIIEDIFKERIKELKNIEKQTFLAILHMEGGGYPYDLNKIKKAATEIFNKYAIAKGDEARRACGRKGHLLIAFKCKVDDLNKIEEDLNNEELHLKLIHCSKDISWLNTDKNLKSNMKFFQIKILKDIIKNNI